MILLVFRGTTEIGWLSTESREEAAKKLGFTISYKGEEMHFYHPVHQGEFFIENPDEITSPEELSKLIAEMDMTGDDALEAVWQRYVKK